MSSIPDPEGMLVPVHSTLLDEEAISERKRHLLKVTELVGGRVGMKGDSQTRPLPY